MIDVNAMVETSTLVRTSGFEHNAMKTTMMSGFRFLNDCIPFLFGLFQVVHVPAFIVRAMTQIPDVLGLIAVVSREF